MSVENAEPTDPGSGLTGREISEDLRASYQAIPQMIAQESSKQWAASSVFIQFSIALVAAAVVPYYIPGFDETAHAYVGIAVSVLGLIASFLWLTYMKRYEKIVLYWVLSAREIEERMGDPVIAFQRGKNFAHGNEVEVSGERIQYQGLERVPVRLGLYLTYIAFGLIFAGLLVLNIARLSSA
jgi:hypothetical protein